MNHFKLACTALGLLFIAAQGEAKPSAQKEISSAYDTYFDAPVGARVRFPDITLESQAISPPTEEERSQPSCLPSARVEGAEPEKNKRDMTNHHVNSMVFRVRDKKTGQQKTVRHEMIWCAETEFFIAGQPYIIKTRFFDDYLLLYKGPRAEMEAVHSRRAALENAKENERICKQNRKYRKEHPEDFKPLVHYVKKDADGMWTASSDPGYGDPEIIPALPEAPCTDKYYPKEYPE